MCLILFSLSFSTNNSKNAAYLDNYGGTLEDTVPQLYFNLGLSGEKT